jgi:hypothetical protein
LPSQLSYFSEWLEPPSRWSARGRGTCRMLVIPTRRSTPDGTRGAHPYAAAARHASRAPNGLARIVSAPLGPPRPGRSCEIGMADRARRESLLTSPPAAANRWGRFAATTIAWRWYWALWASRPAGDAPKRVGIEERWTGRTSSSFASRAVRSFAAVTLDDLAVRRGSSWWVSRPPNPRRNRTSCARKPEVCAELRS